MLNQRFHRSEQKRMGSCAVIYVLTAVHFIFLFLFIPLADAKDPPTLKWLTLSDENLQQWQQVFDPADSARMKITHKKKSESGKKILVLIPKRSKSYILAASELLKILNRNEIYAEILLINFAKNKMVGMEAVIMAEQENYDLIFSMGSGSSAFVHKNYEGGRLPVVTCTQKDPVFLGQMKDYENGSGTNIAYTSLNIPFNIQIDYLYHLKPNLKNIGLMYNKNHKQVMAVEVVPAKKKFKELGLNVFDVAVESRAAAKETLAEKMPAVVSKMEETDPGLKNSIFWITSSTAIFSQVATVNQFSGSIPVLGSIPNIVSEGDDSAVLAIGIDRRNNAQLAAKYAVDILKGKVRPGQLKVGVVTPPDVAVNFRIAKKIGLKIPFRFFESAAFIYDYSGKAARAFGKKVTTIQSYSDREKR